MSSTWRSSFCSVRAGFPPWWVCPQPTMLHFVPAGTARRPLGTARGRMVLLGRTCPSSCGGNRGSEWVWRGQGLMAGPQPLHPRTLSSMRSFSRWRL
jgi:hypothetical protein